LLVAAVAVAKVTELPGAAAAVRVVIAVPLWEKTLVVALQQNQFSTHYKAFRTQ
jgi:hypothetical protein